MADLTKIEWCDATLNLWWGCTKVSDGCKHCYAEAFADGRYRKGNWGPRGERSEVKSWRKTLAQISARAKAENRRLRVFCQSMSDTFEGPDTMGGTDSANWWTVRRLRGELFAAIAAHPELDFLLLTKRPENAGIYVRSLYAPVIDLPIRERGCALGIDHVLLEHGGQALRSDGHAVLRPSDSGDVLPNAWIGTSVEDQKTADERIPHLLKTPAAVRFLSCEPLLGAVSLSHVGGRDELTGCADDDPFSLGMIHWVICGGESGPKARPMHPDWARSLRDQCTAVGIPFLFKQWGEWQDGSDRVARCETVLSNGRHGAGHPETWATYDERIKEWHRLKPTCMSKVGKHRAGRHLDGQAHDAMPEAIRG